MKNDAKARVAEAKLLDQVAALRSTGLTFREIGERLHRSAASAQQLFQKATGRKEGPEAFPIGVFCEKHSISEATFHRLVKANKGPRLMRVGKRVLITQDAAREWRLRMEGVGAAAGLAASLAELDKVAP